VIDVVIANESRRCSARKADGKPCRAWAIRDSDPPLCAAHRGLVEDQLPALSKPSALTSIKDQFPDRGFYSPNYSIEEIVDLVNLTVDDTLDDEVAAARVALRRVMEQFRQELSPLEYGRLSALVFRGTDTIARLLRARRQLTGDAGDAYARAIGEALDQLSREWNIEL
jgi:hypothetical protein